MHFFRDVHGVAPITGEVLRQRSSDYQQWVADFARKRKIPVEWAKKGVRKGRLCAPLAAVDGAPRALRRVYFIPGEHGTRDHFPARRQPKYPTADPNYRILARGAPALQPLLLLPARPRYWGPMALCVGSFLPFSITYYLNGHHFIEDQLHRTGVQFRKTTTPSCGWLTPPPCRLPPTRSAPRSPHPPGLLDLGGGSQSSPRRTVRPSTSAATTRRSKSGVLPQPDLRAQLSHPQDFELLL